MRSRLAALVALLFLVSAGIVSFGFNPSGTLDDRVTALEQAFCEVHPTNHNCVNPTPTPTATLAPTPTPTSTPTPAPTPSPTQPSGATVTGSVSDALKAARPGDTLVLQAGKTYVEDVNVSVTPGTSSQPITLVGNGAVIEGIFWINHPTYWVFDGLRVHWHAGTSSSYHMVKFKGGDHWTVRNSEMWGAESYANILVTNDSSDNPPHDWTIEDSCIHDNNGSHGSNQDHNIYVTDIRGSSGGLITRNTLFDAPGGRNIKLGPASGSGGPNGVTISDNVIWNAGQGISLSGGTSNILIEDNVIAKTLTGDLIDPNNLSGTNDVARNNRGWDSHTGRFIGDSSVTDGGGNVFVSPEFSSLSCP